MSKIKMSDIRAKFPMYEDLSDDELAIAVRKKFYSDVPPAQFYGNIDYDTQRADPTAGMSKTDKLLANIGAGMSDLILGAKQLTQPLRAGARAQSGATDSGDTKEALEAEAAAKRVRDKQLAQSTDMGVMPDWMPTAGSGLQIAGAVAPTMVVPVGATMNALRFLPAAGRAMLGRAAVSAATPARLGSAALAGDAALVGAGTGALEPTTEGESRAWNIIKGAGLNAALPMAGVVGNQVRRITTRSGGAERAGEQIIDDLVQGGGNRAAVLEQTMDTLRNTQPTARGTSIPLSTAAAANSPELARLEAGSRARNGANWYDFDQAQARAVADDVMRATRGADDVAQRRTMRGQNWDTRWAQAQGSANMGAFADDVARFRQRLDDALMSPEASNPAVRNMLEAVAAEVDRLGPNFSLGHLQQIRANLSGKQKALPQNAYQGAPRDSAATRSVLQEADSILNNATNGRWQDVVSGYATDSRNLDAAKAAGRVREAYIDPATNRVRGVSADVAGEVPKITEAGLGRAMDAARGPAKTLALDPAANARLEAVLGALRAQNIVQGVKRSATSGGGSNTASDLAAAKVAGKVADVAAAATGDAGGVVTKTVLDKILNSANAQRDRALAEALQNPAAMIAMLERQVAAGQPLSPLQNQLLALLRGAPSAAGATID